MMKRFYSVREVSELLSISRSSTYGLVRSHALPSVIIAGTLRIPAAALETYADHLEAKALANHSTN
jgi:excisionase family DNA binding protein